MEYKKFKNLRKGVPIPVIFKIIRVHLVFDMKFGLRRKAMLVAGGNLTGPPKD